MKFIGEHRIQQDVRVDPNASTYLGAIADPGSDVDKFLVYGVNGLVGYRTGAEVLSDIGALSTSTTVLAFDGSTANGVCTYKDADEISVESTLTYDSETLNIGADDNGPAYIKRLTHSDEAGGMLQITGGAGTGTNKAGGDLRFAGGQGTGSGVGGNVNIYTAAAGGSGSSTNSYSNTWSFHDTGEFETPGAIELGHASDTTIARVSAGSVTIEGKRIVTAATLGWHGSSTRIKILASDFIPDDGGRPAFIDDTGSGSENFFLESFSSNVLYATVAIPTGFTATHVMIYGSATDAVEVWEMQIDSKTGVSKGTGNVDTEIDITDVASSTTNYLLIQVANASGNEVHGGYVTIAAS